MKFISGEYIQCLCDHFIGFENDFKFNKLILNHRDKFIYIDKNEEEINNNTLIFCYTHLLWPNYYELLINKLNKMKNPFKLVFHNSDLNFTEKYLVLFEKIPLLQYIYTQNMNVNHEKVSPLPIGIANSMWPHGNTEINTEVYNMNIEKTKNIYFNFSIATNQTKRQECYNKIKDKGIEWSNKRSYKDYLIELKKHKYSICPEGNGLDTHRFWECLYLNTIPICKKNILIEYYSKYFPIIILNDWNELDVTVLDKNLKNTQINHYYLSVDYIKNLIKK
tara:strand:- start:4054 stop:4887 length:834 start_codon:yes stop_codon:yes gene_type:complete